MQSPKGLGLFRRLLEGRGESYEGYKELAFGGNLVVAAHAFKSGRSLVLPCILQTSQDKTTKMLLEEGKWKPGAGGN